MACKNPCDIFTLMGGPVVEAVTAGISVICVFNDAAVRAECLDRSLADAVARGQVEYIAVDNVDHTFTSAGAALNHGARQATHDTLVFAHQDVYVHSVAPLIGLASSLEGDEWSLIGAAGITPQGSLVGAMRDRLTLTGASTRDPVTVDSVDEVLFMIRRDRVLEHPLTEDPQLSWHGYAVEYGLRLRAMGLKTGAANTAITHNSLTINLAKLDVAHAYLAQQYAEHVPVQTTCGVLGSTPASKVRDLPVVREHAWRRRWLRESMLALRARRRLRDTRTVLADIRIDLDALTWDSARTLRVVNVDHTGGFAPYATVPVELVRLGRTITFECHTSLIDVMSQPSVPGSSTLYTNVTLEDLAQVQESRSGDTADLLLGVHEDQLWLLEGPVTRQVPEDWSSRRSVPLFVPAI